MCDVKRSKYHVVFRPMCGIRQFEIELFVDYLRPKCDKLLVNYEENGCGKQAGHVDCVLALSPDFLRKKSNLKRDLVKAVFKERDCKNFSNGVYIKYICDTRPDDLRYVLGYSRKEKHPIVCIKGWELEEIEESVKFYMIKKLEYLKKGKMLGVMPLSRKNWDIHLQQWYDMDPNKFSEYDGLARAKAVRNDMLSSGRYVCTFATGPQRWRMFVNYCNQEAPSESLLDEIFILHHDNAKPCDNINCSGYQLYGLGN